MSSDPHAPADALLARRIADPGDVLGSTGALSDRLRGQGIRVCAMDDLEGGPSPAGLRDSLAGSSLTVRQLLEGLTGVGYRWEIAYGELLNILPRRSIVDDPIAPARVDRKGLWRVLEEDLRIEDHGIRLFVELEQGDGPRVALAGDAATLKDSLNALVIQLPGAFWNISGRTGRYFLTISSL